MLGLPQTRVGKLCRLGVAICGAVAYVFAYAGTDVAEARSALALHAHPGPTVAGPVKLRTRLYEDVTSYILEYRVDGVLVARKYPRSRTFVWMLNTHKLANRPHRVAITARFTLRGRAQSRRVVRSYSVANRGRKHPDSAPVSDLGQPGTVPPVLVPPDRTPPSAPTGLAVASASGTTAALSWNAASDNVGVKSYSVRVDGSLVDSTSATALTLSTLRCEWRHSVTVEAVDAAGNRAASQPLSFESGSCATPSGVPMPSTDLSGWKLRFAENFLVDAPKGSWRSDWDATQVVYTGARGTRWVTYPRSYVDTYDKRPYRSDEVLSVHDGVLDFHLHEVDGQPAGANPSPILSTGTQYQTYGRYSARMRVGRQDMSGYWIAWLLWPEIEADWESSESDFPEGSLTPDAAALMGVSHFGPNQQQEVFFTSGYDPHDWHTYTQEWLPGVRRYYVDDQLLFTTSTSIYAKPQRWQLQTETKGNAGGNGHVEVDWAAVWSYNP